MTQSIKAGEIPADMQFEIVCQALHAAQESVLRTGDTNEMEKAARAMAEVGVRARKVVDGVSLGPDPS